ncbi:unnamed protein product [Pleuronectes platessa]|uniref:Uncharacterized protein n=1 Tax=Pleuronectes platessa TaxID=8262 RepID=A0A9N7VMN3_PLEPL|nr:unnamed protein product [Pleuronectes platessa]
MDGLNTVTDPCLPLILRPPPTPPPAAACCNRLTPARDGVLGWRAAQRRPERQSVLPPSYSFQPGHLSSDFKASVGGQDGREITQDSLAGAELESAGGAEEEQRRSRGGVEERRGGGGATGPGQLLDEQGSGTKTSFSLALLHEQRI